MKLIFQVVLLFGSVIMAFGADPQVDFDGVGKKSLNITQELKTISNIKPQSNGNLEVKFFRITESGQQIEIPPSINPETGEKSYYKFKPGENIYWSGGCSGTGNLYVTVCSTYKIYPNYDNAGHAHSENIPGFTWQNSAQPVPATSCFYNVPVNTPATWHVKAPDFAMRSEITVRADCGALYHIADFKIDGLSLLPQAWEDGLHGYTTYYTMSGKTPAHPINHFGQSWAIDLWKQIAWQYHVEFSTFPSGKVLDINDMSLKWGGLFDIGPEPGCTYDYGNGYVPCKIWNIPHAAHQRGRQADVRRRNLTGTQQRRLIKIACDHGVDLYLEKADGTLIDPATVGDLSSISSTRAPHFHFRFPRYDSEPEDPPNEQPKCKPVK